jgi:hypothetical protein
LEKYKPTLPPCTVLIHQRYAKLSSNSSSCGLSPLDILAQEIVDDLEASLEQLREIAAANLGAESAEPDKS